VSVSVHEIVRFFEGGTMEGRLRFGAFLAPFHTPVSNPTLALRRDLELVQELERLGFDEVWFGEHHSGGTELYGSPELMIAAAAEMTKRIRLGTGVLSIPYHHPFMVAERMNLLDHLTHGRAMFGVGPGILPSDAWMIGVDVMEQRRMMREGFEAIMALLRHEGPVTMETDWFTLRDARLQLRSYSPEGIDTAVASTVSPVGAEMAGKHGVGLLSIGATTDAGFAALAGNWKIAEDEAAKAGRAVSRKNWRLLGVVHLAETREQAIEDVRYGLDHYFEYFQKTIAVPQFEVGGETFEERVEFMEEAGVFAIGTVEDAIAQIDRLVAQAGGFGTYLLQGHNLANPEATRRSYELFARHVMPHFQDATASRLESEAFARSIRPEMFKEQKRAVDQEIARYQAEHPTAPVPAS
jgi:limonene 1,2-monooxygenase